MVDFRFLAAVLACSLGTVTAKDKATFDLRPSVPPGEALSIEEENYEELDVRQREGAETLNWSRGWTRDSSSYTERTVGAEPLEINRRFKSCRRAAAATDMKKKLQTKPEETADHPFAGQEVRFKAKEGRLEREGDLPVSEATELAILRVSRLLRALLPKHPLPARANWQPSIEDVGRALFGRKLSKRELKGKASCKLLSVKEEKNGHRVAECSVSLKLKQQDSKDSPIVTYKLEGKIRVDVSDGFVKEFGLEGGYAYSMTRRRRASGYRKNRTVVTRTDATGKIRLIRKATLAEEGEEEEVVAEQAAGKTGGELTKGPVAKAGDLTGTARGTLQSVDSVLPLVGSFVHWGTPWNGKQSVTIYLLGAPLDDKDAARLLKEPAVFVFKTRPSPDPAHWQWCPYGEITLRFPEGAKSFDKTTLESVAVAEYGLNHPLDSMKHVSFPRGKQWQEEISRLQIDPEKSRLELVFKGVQTYRGEVRLGWDVELTAPINRVK